MTLPAVVIIEDEEPRIIGPFPSGEEASNWAFRTLPFGVQWHWCPLEAPQTKAVYAMDYGAPQ